jgi:hypothetical protein
MAPKKNNRYRNPANDIVDAAERAAKRALDALKASGRRSIKGAQAASARSAERFKDDVAADNSLRAQLLRNRHAVANAPKNGDVTVKEGNTFTFKDGKWNKHADVKNYKDAQGNLYDGNSGQLIKAAPTPAAPLSNAGQRVAPPASPAPQGPSVHAPRVEKAAPVFPTEKAYGESGKDLYMANKGNNPLMQRTFGYQTGKAPDQVSQAPAAPTPAPAAPTRAQDQIPHNPGLTVSEPIAQQVVEKVAESLFEQMQRRKGKLRGAGYDLNNNIG